MKKILTLTISAILLSGCGATESENANDNTTNPSPIPTPIETPDMSNPCNYLEKNGEIFPVEVFQSISPGGTKITQVGYKPNPNYDSIVLHNECGPAFVSSTTDDLVWLESWLVDGQFYRGSDLPSQIEYVHSGNVVYVNEQRWLSGNNYKQRSNGKANRILFNGLYGDTSIRGEEWVKSAKVYSHGQHNSVKLHRDRKAGPAKIDYSWQPTTFYYWFENNRQIKEKNINSENGYSSCTYYIDGNTYDDSGCVSESQYDSDFGFK